MAAPVKLTDVPAQTGPGGLAVTEMLTGRLGFTVITIVFEMAGFPVAQVALEVNRQVITSPFEGI